MPDTATAPKRCANCKAQLPDTPVSICPYCVMPITEGGDDQGRESKNAPRLSKIRASEAFASAQTTAPPETPAYQEGVKLSQVGSTLAVLGVILGGVGYALEGLHTLAYTLAGALTSIGIIQVVRGNRLKGTELAPELLCRPAIILSRRSEVTLRGYSGDTTYFFELELEGGAIAEFAYPGRGPSANVYTNNLSGIAYTRGGNLLEFKQVRT